LINAHTFNSLSLKNKQVKLQSVTCCQKNSDQRRSHVPRLFAQEVTEQLALGRRANEKFMICTNKTLCSAHPMYFPLTHTVGKGSASETCGLNSFTLCAHSSAAKQHAAIIHFIFTIQLHPARRKVACVTTWDGFAWSSNTKPDEQKP